MTMGKGKIWWRERQGARPQPLFLALHRPVGNATGDDKMSLTQATDRRKKMPYDIVRY